MKYYIKQKVFSFKDQFKIFDEQENLEYQVQGKFMSFSNKLQFLNAQGDVLYRAHKKVFSILPKYFIFNDKNQEIAVIKKFFGFRPKFKIYVRYKELNLQGDLFAHSFVVEDQDKALATIQKKYISWGDTYEIEVFSEEDRELYLFLVIILDQVIHEKRH